MQQDKFNILSCKARLTVCPAAVRGVLGSPRKINKRREREKMVSHPELENRK